MKLQQLNAIIKKLENTLNRFTSEDDEYHEIRELIAKYKSEKEDIYGGQNHLQFGKKLLDIQDDVWYNGDTI